MNQPLSQEIADKFRDFLLDRKTVPADTAQTVASSLGEFLTLHVPEIEAISTLRETARTIDPRHYPKYSEREKFGIDDPFAWYDRFYRKGAEDGTVNTTTMFEADSAFASVLTRAVKKQGMSLIEFMHPPTTPTAKIAALSVVLASTPETAAKFLATRGSYYRG